jgi:hypothetical protein
VPSFPWLAVGLLAFWCLIAGVFLGQFLPLPPMPRGPILFAIALVLALGIGRAVWALRLTVRAWMAHATESDAAPHRRR